MNKEAVRQKIVERHESIKAHEDSKFFNDMTQMKLVIKGFKQPDFQASDKNLTHLLFMKPWQSNFICNEDISAHEKKYIEDLVTP